MASRDAIARPRSGATAQGLPATKPRLRVGAGDGVAQGLREGAVFLRQLLGLDQALPVEGLKVKDLPSFMITLVRKAFCASRPGS